jgi:hypothetical protein
MKEKNDTDQQSLKMEVQNETENSDGYPIYPENEDIYNKFKKIRELEPDEIALINESNIDLVSGNEVIVEEDFIGNNLDLAEAELSVNQEDIDLENEEKNYFSLNNEDTDEDLGQI